MAQSSANARFNDAADSSDLVQLAKSVENNFIVDLEAVKAVLENPIYKDHYVAIYTIAGPSRTGKSFLLNLFWNFLQCSDRIQNYEQWLRIPRQVRQVFKWRKSVKPHTQGIHILKEPIVISHNGKKIALFLADTQGIFDHKTSQRNQTFLGTFSFLISSFMIYNVQNRIETTHLDAIYKGANNLRGSDGFYMMQKESLMFVVRDWDNAGNDGNDDDEDQSYAYGMDGGKRYFKTLIQEDDPNRAVEHQMMREYMEFAFDDNIPCCLLPHPGDAVKSTTCSAADLNDDFQREIFKFFQEIKRGCKINIKTIQREQYKCGELYEAIKDYVAELGPHLDVTDHDSFLVKDFRAKMSMHVKKHVEDFFMLSTNQDWERDTARCVNNLDTLKQQIISDFRRKAETFFRQRSVFEWEEELNRVLSQAIKHLKTSLRVAEFYRKAILDFRNWQNANAILHLTDRQKTAITAREIRELSLNEMKESIRQQVQDEEVFDCIFSQCKQYFMVHTNKLSAAIDEDIESFLKKIENTQTGIKFVALALVLAISVAASVLAPLSKTVRAASSTTTDLKSAAANAFTAVGRSDFSSGFAESASNLAARYFEKKYVKQIQAKITTAAENQDSSSLQLQQYANGEMMVKLSFGYLRFSLEVRER